MKSALANICGLVLLFSGSVCSGSDSGAFVLFETEVVSEPEPLHASFDDWGSRFERGERQWALANAEVGVRYRGVSVSVQQRTLMDLRINPAAAAFYGRMEREEALTPGKTVPVHIEVNSFSAKGLKLGYRYDARTWWLGASAALLQARHLMSGALDGAFTATTPQDYDFNAQVDYHYYRDPIFDRPNINTPVGIGHSVQLRGAWRINPHWRLRGRADDLLAAIRWEDAPYTEAEALTNRKRYDEEGYAVFDPFLSGREGYRDVYRQELEPRYRASSEFLWGGWSAHVRGRYQFGYAFAGYGAGWETGDRFGVRATVWPALNALGLELNWHELHLALSLDEVEKEEAHVFHIAFSYGY